MKYALTFNRSELQKKINELTMPWEGMKVLVEVRKKNGYILRFAR